MTRTPHGAGLRVLLTRSAEDCAAWAEELERLDITAVSLPCIAAEAIDTPELRDALAASAREADWIVFTSRRGVEAYVRLTGDASGASAATARPAESAALAARSLDTSASPPSLRVAAVGAGTAQAATKALGRVDLVGETGTAESLARTLIDALGRVGVLVLLALAENAPDTLERALTGAGIECRRFNVYRTVPAAPASAKRPLASLGVDAVLLASPSAVRGFANQIEIDASTASTPLVTIGPTTSAAARKLGLDVAGEAREPSLEALLEALLAAVPGRATQRGSNHTENSHA